MNTALGSEKQRAANLACRENPTPRDFSEREQILRAIRATGEFPPKTRGGYHLRMWVKRREWQVKKWAVLSLAGIPSMRVLKRARERIGK